MNKIHTLALALTLALSSGVAMAQSMGREGTRDRTTTGRGLDAVGRANTSDPNSAMSGGTDASGHPVNPMADPRQR